MGQGHISGKVCCLPAGMSSYENSRDRSASWVGLLNLDDYAHLKRNLENYRWPPTQLAVFHGIIRRLLAGSDCEDFTTTLYPNKTQPREACQRWTLCELEIEDDDVYTVAGHPVKNKEIFRSAVACVIQGLWVDEIEDAELSQSLEMVRQRERMCLKYAMNPILLFNLQGNCLFQNPVSVASHGDLVNVGTVHRRRSNRMRKTALTRRPVNVPSHDDRSKAPAERSALDCDPSLSNSAHLHRTGTVGSKSSNATVMIDALDTASQRLAEARQVASRCENDNDSAVHSTLAEQRRLLIDLSSELRLVADSLFTANATEAAPEGPGMPGMDAEEEDDSTSGQLHRVLCREGENEDVLQNVIFRGNDSLLPEMLEAVIARRGKWLGELSYVSEARLNPDEAGVDDGIQEQLVNVVQVEAGFSRDPLTGLDCISLAMVDVTERVQARQELEEQRRRANLLLYKMLPPRVAKLLLANLCDSAWTFPSESFDCVTIGFLDIVGYTSICQKLHPFQVKTMLDRFFLKLDALVAVHNLYKVETVGDAYLVIAGGNFVEGDEPALQAARMGRFALDAVAASSEVTVLTPEEAASSVISGQFNRNEARAMQMQHIDVRLGVHSGPVVCSVVGNTQPRYSLFGDTVNVTARLETSSEANHVHISKSFHNELLKTPRALLSEFILKSRGEPRHLKGVKDPVETFFMFRHPDFSSAQSVYHSKDKDRLADVSPDFSSAQSVYHSKDKDRLEDVSHAQTQNMKTRFLKYFERLRKGIMFMTFRTARSRRYRPRNSISQEPSGFTNEEALPTPFVSGW